MLLLALVLLCFRKRRLTGATVEVHVVLVGALLPRNMCFVSDALQACFTSEPVGCGSSV